MPEPELRPTSEDTQKETVERIALRTMLERERLDRWKALYIMAAIAMAIFLLAFFVYRAALESRERQLASEDAQWRETLKAISSGPNQVDSLTAAILLRPFLQSSRYRNEALIASRLLMPQMNSYDAFEYLFNSAYPTPNEHLDDVVEINRRVYTRYQELSQAKSSANPATGAAAQLLQSQLDEVVKELKLSGNTIGKGLRRLALDNTKLDLAGVFFYQSDLSGTSLDGAILDGAAFQDVDISGASLMDVKQFDTSNWYYTRWWVAKRMSPSLLLFLKSRYQPYSHSNPYKGMPSSESEYISNLQRLCEQAHVDCSKEAVVPHADNGTFGKKEAKLRP